MVAMRTSNRLAHARGSQAWCGLLRGMLERPAVVGVSLGRRQQLDSRLVNLADLPHRFVTGTWS